MHVSCGLDEIMKTLTMAVLAVVIGVAITLVTGFVGHTPDGLMGATWFGYPLAWLVEMVVGPGYNPWVVRPLRLIADMVAWTVLAWVILFVVARSKKKTP